jgi:polysaccharide pyruvyl transferase CsaB
VRVLLSGYYGFGNVGDEAILAALATGLRSHGHEVEVLSADPDATRRSHDVTASRRLTGLPWALARADALVSGGGGLLQDATSLRSLRYYLGVLRAARATGLRTVVYGQSIGPLSSRGRAWTARALRGLPVAVRDDASRSLLATAGIPAARVADAALALPRPERLGGAGLLLVPRAGVAGASEALARLARVAMEDGTEVRIVALQPGAAAAAAQRIAEAVVGARTAPPTGPEAALAACGAADAVVSVRLHGLILAARAGTPHLGIGYDPKVAGFLASSGGRHVEVPVPQEALTARWRAGEVLGRRDVALGDALAQEAEAGLTWLDRALRARVDDAAR